MSARTALILLALVPFVAPMAPAQKKDKAPTFDVVQVGEERRVMESSAVAALKKQIATEDKAAAKEWSTAKAAARTAKEKFTTPQPKPRKVVVVARGLASREEADAVAAGEKPAGGKRAPRSSGGWVVIDVGGTHRVVESGAVADLKKETAAENKKALADWNQAKKDAKKSKEKFATPRPKPVALKTVGKTFKTEEEAREFLAGLKKG